MNGSSPNSLSRQLVPSAGSTAMADLVTVPPGTPVHAASQYEGMTVFGGGVKLKQMPSPDGSGVVRLRELFSFEAQYAQCSVEANPAPFVMETHEMRHVLSEPHRSFVTMYAYAVYLVSIREAGNGFLVPCLIGDMVCTTEMGKASATVGSREAVDGGHGRGAAGDRSPSIVYCNPERAPIDHATFGTEAAFTGKLIAGDVAIGAPAVLPLPPATPAVSIPEASRSLRRKRGGHRALDARFAGDGPGSRDLDPAARRANHLLDM